MQTETNFKRGTLMSKPLPQKKLREEMDLPPISYSIEKPRCTSEYFTFNFSKGTTLCRMKSEDLQIQSVEKIDHSDELVNGEKEQIQKIERSCENSMECEEPVKQQIPQKECHSENVIHNIQSVQIQQNVHQPQIPQIPRRTSQNVQKPHGIHNQMNIQIAKNQNAKEKKPKLRIQTNTDKKNRPLIPIKPSKPSDPNVSRRKEMMKTLRIFQRQSIHSPMKVSTPQNSEMRIRSFLRDVNEYCGRNGLFQYEMKESNEIIVYVNMFGEKKMTILFDLNDANYENWNFPKPKTIDGREVCDKGLMDKMRKQPCVETFMNEMFRVATAYMAE